MRNIGNPKLKKHKEKCIKLKELIIIIHILEIKYNGPIIKMSHIRRI